MLLLPIALNRKPKESEKKNSSKQVIKNIGNVTVHRNGQSVTSGQTSLEWPTYIPVWVSCLLEQSWLTMHLTHTGHIKSA